MYIIVYTSSFEKNEQIHFTSYEFDDLTKANEKVKILNLLNLDFTFKVVRK